MKSGDRDLGMDRPISRRDFLHGMGALAAGTWVPGRALAEKADAIERAFGMSSEGESHTPHLAGRQTTHLLSLVRKVELLTTLTLISVS